MKVLLAVLVTAFTLTLAAPWARAQCVDWKVGPLDNGSAPNGANGSIDAMAYWDPDGAGPLPTMLVVGGSFTSIGGVSANHIAARDPVTGAWQALGAGVGTNVFAITVYNGNLVVGGTGDNDPGTADNNLLWWDGSTWNTFNGGTSTGTVYALTVYNGQLYAGGSFVIFPTVLDPAHNFARWNAGAGLWEDVNSGTDNTVYAFLQFNGDLVVAGAFLHAGGSPEKYIARWNGSWQPLGSGSDQNISALTLFNGQIVAASSYPTPSGYEITAGAWDGSAWHPFGAGFPNGMDNIIWSLGVYNGQLVAGGYFTHANSQPANHIALWNGSAWTPLLGGTDSPVLCMLPFSGELLAGGTFTHVDSRPANRIARWNGLEWSSLGGGTTTAVYALTNFLGNIVAGGDFRQSTDPGVPAQ